MLDYFGVDLLMLSREFSGSLLWNNGLLARESAVLWGSSKQQIEKPFLVRSICAVFSFCFRLGNGFYFLVNQCLGKSLVR